MYIPASFREDDLSRLDWLAEYDSFGTLISMLDGAPFATHLPVLYRRTGTEVVLQGHWAKPNPQWHAVEGQRVLFIFHGPHSYISPRWYVEPKRNVPTWNYATAHVYGGIRVIHESDRIEGIVSALADYYERGAQNPWRMADSEGRDRLRGIVGFELFAERIELKFKLSQNHVRANVEGAVAGLSASDSADSLSIAALMRQALNRTAGST